jgi:hypothetical protein
MALFMVDETISTINPRQSKRVKKVRNIELFKVLLS